MLALVTYTAVVALGSAFVLMLANKWRWLEWAQVAVTAVLAWVTGDWMALLSPVLATPIAVRLW